MNIIFFGLGSIGLRYLRLIKSHYEFNIAAFRTNKGQLLPDVNVNEILSWDEVIHFKPDIAFITNPTSLHIETAIKCAIIGCDLFVEKPIGSNTDRLDELLSIVNSKQLTAYVGYNLRFHPVIQALVPYFKKYHFLHMRVECSSYLPDWRPHQNHLKGYSANKSMGGGVVLDLSHEIDYVAHLLGEIKKISGRCYKRSSVTVDAEDSADIFVDSEKGPAMIHINFFSHGRYRTLRIDFQELAVVGDLMNGTLIEYSHGNILDDRRFDIDINELYLKQLGYFFSNINNPAMMNNLSEASDLFQKIVLFKEACIDT